VGIHGDYVPVLYDACKYIGVKPDLYDDNEEKVRAFCGGNRRGQPPPGALGPPCRPALWLIRNRYGIIGKVYSKRNSPDYQGN
jgi:hypothetical protein